MTEQELAVRAGAGDQDAFEQLMRGNEKRIYNLALRMTGNPDDAMDLSQEAFLNAWRGLKFFKGESSFSTWLYRLASNVCIDYLRKQSRRREISPTVSLEEGEESPLDLPDERYSPEVLLERREKRRAVERGLARLNDGQRQVLVMRELSGMSYQEIGQALDLEEGTVKSRIARARMALRKILLADGNFFEETASKHTEAKNSRRKE